MARSKGEAALAAGEAGAATQHFSKAVEVTYDMAFALIKVSSEDCSILLGAFALTNHFDNIKSLHFAAVLACFFLTYP